MTTYTDALEALCLWQLTEDGRHELARKVWDHEVEAITIAEGPDGTFAVLADGELVCRVKPEVLTFIRGMGNAAKS